MQDDSTRFSVSHTGPKSLKLMRPADVAQTLADDPRVIVPVGTCEAYDDALPMGCASLLVERLASDLSAEFGVLMAPTVEYGVNGDTPAYPGRVALRKKTLHRTLNDMLASWEMHGVSEFILLTAHGYDPHQEALGTVSTVSARVRVVDVFAVNLSDLVGSPNYTSQRSPLFLALLKYLAPDLVDSSAATPGVDVATHGSTAHGSATAPTSSVVYDAALGRASYERIRSRISERIFLAPAPVE